MIKVSSQSNGVYDSYDLDKFSNLAWHFVWQLNFLASVFVTSEHEIEEVPNLLEWLYIVPSASHLTPTRPASDGLLRVKMIFNLAWQKIEVCLYTWNFEKNKIKKTSKEPMSYIFEKYILYITNISNCQNSNDN